MELSDLYKIIQQREGLRIEFKEAQSNVPTSFYETVVSFSNTDGGTILLGVDDEGTVIGIDPASETKLKKDITTALNTSECINPSIYIQPFTLQHPDGLVLVVQIPISSQMHDHKGRIYSRDFESDLDITNNDQRKGDLYLRKRNFFTEAQIYPALSMDDLDPALFDKARQIIRGYKSDHPWLFIKNEDLLRESVLWRKDFTSASEGLTLAAALIFGKDTTIQSLLPAYKVEAMVRIADKDRWDDRLTLRTNLIDTYLGLKQFVNKHLPEKFHLDGGQRIDLRDIIFREVIANVVIHREYTSALATELIIGKTEVFITNANKPHFHGPIDPSGFNPFPKNPNIRKLFTAFGWADEIGSGIRNTNKFLPLYSSGALPVFYENDPFETELPLVLVTLSDFSQDFQKLLGLPSEAITHLKSGLSHIALSTSLFGLDFSSVLLELVPSWHRKGTKLQELSWPGNQLHTKEEIKKVPSWSENGTTLLTKKAAYIITILMLSAEPISLEQLMNWMEYKNKKTFRDNYLSPLQQAGLIQKTIEDARSSPDQKYITTEAGKIFLGDVALS